MYRVFAGFVLGAALASPLPSSARDLTFEERVQAQEAIERVYYAHQIGATQPFEEAVPRAVLERKVTTYLKQSVALEKIWHTPVTSTMLRREMERQARVSRLPERLGELYAALGNDPFLLGECLARPVLVDRLARSFQARDATIQGTAKREAEAVEAELRRTGTVTAAGSFKLRELEVVRIEGNAEGESAHPPNRMELSPEAYARFRERLPSRAGEVGAIEESEEAFTVRLIRDERDGTLRLGTYTVRKEPWDSWWERVSADLDASGVHAVSLVGSVPALRAAAGSSSAASSCVPDDTWDPGALDDPPTTGTNHVAVWTGSVMIVWGGWAPGYVNVGSRYDPATDTWARTSTIGAPAGRANTSAVWTGAEMIVWGGYGGSYLSSGGRYDPSSDTWTSTSEAGAPSGRYRHRAVWTGSEMIVWGGTNDSAYFNTGGRYDPANDTWTPLSTAGAPSARDLHSMVWCDPFVGIFGGRNVVGLDTGGIYDPVSDTWRTTSLVNAPAKRHSHSAVCNGSSMIVWGGKNVPAVYNDGGMYDLFVGGWTPLSTVNAPQGRGNHSAVWTGEKMIVWGGDFGYDLDDGASTTPSPIHGLPPPSRTRPARAPCTLLCGPGTE